MSLEMNEMQKAMSEMKEEITKLHGKSEIWLEILEFKDKSFNEKINLLKIEIGTLTSQISTLKQELIDTSAREKNSEKSVFLTKPYMYSRFFADYYLKEPNFIWTIEDLKNEVNQSDNNLALLSEVFPLKGYSFGAQAKLTLNKENNSIYVSLAYKDVNKSGKALNLKAIPDLYYTLKKQPSKNYVNHANSPFTSVVHYDTFYSERWIIASKNLTNDPISINIHVEPPQVTEHGYSYDGTLAWAIHDFRKKKEIEEEGLVWFQKSPYFYTSPKGYRMVSYVRLNGYGWNGLTASIDFLTGPYDKELGESFKHKSTVTLFHPNDPSKHVVKSMERDLKDGSWYMINVATHQEVEQLLDNDTLHYQIQIVPV